VGQSSAVADTAAWQDDLDSVSPERELTYSGHSRFRGQLPAISAATVTCVWGTEVAHHPGVHYTYSGSWNDKADAILF
jgi:hypothetical protein